MEINGKKISSFSALLLKGLKIGTSAIESNYFQGRNRSSYNLISQTYGLKPITLGIMFTGDNRDKIAVNKSLLDLELIGNPEIYLDNGYYYTCVLISAGELEYDGKEYARAYYEFVGIQHKPLVTVKSSTFSCSSTVPFTDCIITGTATAATGSIGGITFSGATVGKVLVVDGINKRFLYDGSPAAQKFVWVNFPALVPKENTIATTGLSGVTIEYYPTFM
ncbi:MAG: hypothetical protein EOM37_11595 [Proteobacteria bacterium]|nr:hypothetical protein [Pseudomonadota bacterium]